MIPLASIQKRHSPPFKYVSYNIYSTPAHCFHSAEHDDTGLRGTCLQQYVLRFPGQPGEPGHLGRGRLSQSHKGRLLVACPSPRSRLFPPLFTTPRPVPPYRPFHNPLSFLFCLFFHKEPCLIPDLSHHRQFRSLLFSPIILRMGTPICALSEKTDGIVIARSRTDT